MSEEQRKPKSSEPTPELPDEGADIEPQAQPLTHHEPDEAHAADVEHGHEEARLGPVDWPAWSYAVIGVAVALAVVAAFWIAAY